MGTEGWGSPARAKAFPGLCVCICPHKRGAWPWRQHAGEVKPQEGHPGGAGGWQGPSGEASGTCFRGGAPRDFRRALMGGGGQQEAPNAGDPTPEPQLWGAWRPQRCRPSTFAVTAARPPAFPSGGQRCLWSLGMTRTVEADYYEIDNSTPPSYGSRRGHILELVGKCWPGFLLGEGPDSRSQMCSSARPCPPGGGGDVCSRVP